MVFLLVLLALILLIFFVPYGVDAAYSPDEWYVKVKAGPLRVQLFPKKKKAAKPAGQKKEKKPKKESAKKKDKKKKEKEKKPPDIDFIIALAEMAVRAIKRLFRSFHLDRLRFHYICASGDPYNTAMQYGYICGAVTALSEHAAGKITCGVRDIYIDSDFLAEKPTVDVRLVISLRLFKIVHLAVAFGVEFIIWKIQQIGMKSDKKERTEHHGRKQNRGTDGCNDHQNQAAG